MSVSHSIYKHVLNIYVPLDKCICIHVPVCVCLIFQDEVLTTLFLLYILYYEALVLVVSGLSGLTGYQMDAENEGFLKPQELRLLRVTQGDGLGGKCRSIQYFGWERAGAEVEGREGVWGMSRPSSHLPQPLQMERMGLHGQGISGREASCTSSLGLHHPTASAPWGFHWPGRRDRKWEGPRGLWAPQRPPAWLYKGHLLLSRICHYFSFNKYLESNSPLLPLVTADFG